MCTWRSAKFRRGNVAHVGTNRAGADGLLVQLSTTVYRLQVRYSHPCSNFVLVDKGRHQIAFHTAHKQKATPSDAGYLSPLHEARLWHSNWTLSMFKNCSWNCSPHRLSWLLARALSRHSRLDHDDLPTFRWYYICIRHEQSMWGLSGSVMPSPLTPRPLPDYYMGSRITTIHSPWRLLLIFTDTSGNLCSSTRPSPKADSTRLFVHASL